MVVQPKLSVPRPGLKVVPACRAASKSPMTTTLSSRSTLAAGVNEELPAITLRAQMYKFWPGGTAPALIFSISPGTSRALAGCRVENKKKKATESWQNYPHYDIVRTSSFSARDDGE